MAKKYYWLKLKSDFFTQPRVKKLRRIAGGDTYTIIYLKMQLLSLKDDGKLFFEGIEENFIEEIALTIDEDVENVSVTIQYLLAQGLMEKVEEGEYLMTETQCLIGTESESAVRMRKKREKDRKQLTLASHCDGNVIESDTEIEIEKELEIEKDINNHCGESSVEPKVPTPPKEKNQPTEFDFNCTNILIQSCLKLFPNSKVPDTDAKKLKWAQEVEKMRRLDNRSEADILEALRFAVTDSFWKTNIRSTKKFREKFETLILQGRGPRGRRSAQTTEEYLQNTAGWYQ